MADISRAGDIDVRIVDATSQYTAKVDSIGNIYASGGASNAASLGKLFWLPVAVNITPANTEVNILHILNPSGSGKTVILCCVDYGFSNTTAVAARFKWYSNPTITAAGTTVTPVNGLIGSAVTSAINTYTSPTHSARGTEMVSHSVYGGTQSFAQFLFDGRIVIPANNRILLTGTPDGVNRGTLINLRWIEI